VSNQPHCQAALFRSKRTSVRIWYVVDGHQNNVFEHGEEQQNISPLDSNRLNRRRQNLCFICGYYAESTLAIQLLDAEGISWNIPSPLPTLRELQDWWRRTQVGSHCCKDLTESCPSLSLWTLHNVELAGWCSDVFRRCTVRMSPGDTQHSEWCFLWDPSFLCASFGIVILSWLSHDRLLPKSWH
jgi:hypothetical protein